MFLAQDCLHRVGSTATQRDALVQVGEHLHGSKKTEAGVISNIY